MKIFKNIIVKIFPIKTREWFRNIIFKHFRNLGLLKYLTLFKLLTCNKYIHINHSTVDNFLESNHSMIKASKFLETDKIKQANYIFGDLESTIQPFTATTETVILEISDLTFSFRNNHLLDKNLNIIGETRTSKLENILPLYIYKQFLPYTVHFEGTVAYLSDPDPLNYYHWMCRVLPLLKFYKQNFQLFDIDYFYIGQFPLSNFHKETLEAAGIPFSRIIQTACTADKLVIAITNRSLDLGNQINDPINKESYLFTRNLFSHKLQHSSQSEKRRLYIKRGSVSRRKLINEIEVIQLLEQYGFESVVMDNKTVQEQAELFFKAEVVVALHGAALTNLLFIEPGTKVIELAPFGYINNCFYTLSSHAKADYFYLQGEKLNQEDADLRSLNTCIDIQKLSSLLQKAALNEIKTKYLV